MARKRSIGLKILIPSMAVALGGCTLWTENPKKLDLGVDPVLGPLANSAAYRDTIGAYTFYDGMASMRVRAYGLVVGLGRNGSRDCPRHVYKRLVQNLYKQHRFSSTVVGVQSITPEALIDDLDTAVVSVMGDIPPATVRGNRFDVAVVALPGTQTKSLRGGRLYTADLEMFRPVSPTISITGQVLARASGPMFLNPFSEGESATRSNPLEASIIGGGEVVKDRRVRLVLLEPSHQRARQIQDRINSCFPSTGRVADAVSPSFVRINIPNEFADDTGHFLALVRALFLSHDPRFAAVRARALAEEIIRPTAPHARIALAFEGLGRQVLPVVGKLYVHPEDYVGFHAAVAGLRLGDHIASDAMIMHAGNSHSEYRFKAIHALAGARGMAGAAVALRRLLHDKDPRVQIAAYEALLQRQDPTIASRPIGGDNFKLDQITTDGSNFIYVKRSGSRRIALFGRDLRCLPPLLYRAADGSLMMSAQENDETLTILRTIVATGSMSPVIPAPFELPALIRLMGNKADVDYAGNVVGLGLDYTAVVAAIYNLYQDQAVNSKFILQQPNVAELFGPARPEGRPESEL